MRDFVCHIWRKCIQQSNEIIMRLNGIWGIHVGALNFVKTCSECIYVFWMLLVVDGGDLSNDFIFPFFTCIAHTGNGKYTWAARASSKVFKYTYISWVPQSKQLDFFPFVVDIRIGYERNIQTTTTPKQSFDMYSPSKAINHKPDVIRQYQWGCPLTLMIFLNKQKYNCVS